MGKVINPFWFGGYETVTISSGTVGSDLTDFPVMVRLSDLSANFWNNVQPSGGDIRARDTSGNLIPHDLSRFDYSAQDGVLWVKATITASGDTTFRIYWGFGNFEQLAPTDTNGREAVWSDYEAVYLGGEDIIDRSGNSDALFFYGDPDLFDQTATSGDINCHEGIASDGTYYYGFDSFAIRKFDGSFSLQTEVTNIATRYNNGLGDGCVVDGIIYVAADNAGTQYLAKYNASDLSFIEDFDISSFATGACGFCFNPHDGFLYTIPYTTSPGTSSLIKINIRTGANEGTITMDNPVIEAQGIAFWRDAFWVAADNVDETFRINLDGSFQIGTANGLFGPRSLPTTWEGLDVTLDGNGLVQVDDTGTLEVVRTYKPFDHDLSGGGGFECWADARMVGTFSSAGALGTSWTVGASFKPDDTVQRAFLGIGVTGGYSPTASVNCYCDNVGGSVINLGVFDGSNSWLYNSPAQVPSTSAMQRMNLIYNGTTARHLFFNGGFKGTDNTITARGSTNSLLVIGAPLENAYTDAFRGLIGFVYARAGVLSDDWIAAEYANLNDPSSFYTIS